MSKLFIDISDLLIYAVNNRRITGIQRVEISILQYMIDQKIEYSLVNAFGAKNTRIDSIIRDNISSTDRLLQALKHECRYSFSYQLPHQIIRFFQRLSQKLLGDNRDSLKEMRPGDTLFVPGAFWLATEIMRFYEAASAKGIKLVVFIYDVLPVTHPHLMVKNSDFFFGAILKLPISVITDSRSTEHELPQAVRMIEGAQLPISVEVVPLAHELPGVERNQQPCASSDRLKKMIGARNFVLYVGTVEIRKNHLRLIEVWNELSSELGEKLPLLAIAGKKGWEAEQVIALLDTANENHKKTSREPVIFVEGPTDEELQWLYTSCDFTVFPSLAEGWGLPVGEGLWLGKACAASNASSIPEVGEDLCVYFDPTDLADMKSAITRLLDPEIRKSFEDKIRTADLRTWNRVASDVVKALMKLAA